MGPFRPFDNHFRSSTATTVLNVRILFVLVLEPQGILVFNVKGSLHQLLPAALSTSHRCPHGSLIRHHAEEARSPLSGPEDCTVLRRKNTVAL